MFLPRRRVLQAAQVPEPVDLHDADVRTGALADLVGASFGDLVRQERVSDRRARGADQVPPPGTDDRGHEVGARHAPDADDRLRGGLADPTGPLELVPLLEVPRRAGVLAPERDRAHVHVPQVDECVGELHELERLVDDDAGRAERIDRDTGDDRAIVAHGLAGRVRGSRARSARGARGIRRRHRFACCRTARGTASAGTSGRRRRRRCRSRSRGRAGRRLTHSCLDRSDVAKLHRLRHDVRLEVRCELARSEREPARLRCSERGRRRDEARCRPGRRARARCRS